MKTPPPVQIEKVDAATYFARFAAVLKDNPPGPFDYPMIHRLERVGFKQGQRFDLNAAPSTIKLAFERAITDGKATVAKAAKQASGEGEKGWVYTTRSGAYGVDYSYRAAIALCCLGENLPQDAVYPSLSTDSEGRPLDGESRYVLYFDKGRFPPVDAFWSVTSSAWRSVTATNSSPMPTARSTSSSSPTRRAPTRKGTGYRWPRRRSPCSCASIRRRPQSSMAPGRRRR
jgi:hypothetical protein